MDRTYIASELVKMARELVSEDEFKPSTKLQKAIKRRNVDLKGGRLLLVTGKPPTKQNADVLIRRTQGRIDDREETIKRLEALSDDASVDEVRKTLGIIDSRATDKRKTLSAEKSKLRDSHQYVEDIELAVKEYGESL